MDPDYLPFHPAPSKPVFSAPADAVDAHCHVFGPAHRFPYAEERKYTPCDAPWEKLLALRQHLGFSRNVIVQASCHGRDNSALVDALTRGGDSTRGVAVVGADVTDQSLAEMHEAGVRAVRFNFLKRLVDSAPKDQFLQTAHRVSELGWHVVVYLESADLNELTPFLLSLPTVVVVDHMGRPEIAEGPGGASFNGFIDLMSRHDRIWTKVSCPERLSLSGPAYDDVVPFARTLVERFPDRVLWGTDWPHPNMKSHVPDDGMLVDVIPRIAVSTESRQKLLVDNPNRLYWL